VAIEKADVLAPSRIDSCFEGPHIYESRVSDTGTGKGLLVIDGRRHDQLEVGPGLSEELVPGLL
jgi:hypothetical protein